MGIALGEASPNYLLPTTKQSPISQTYVPKAKLIAILRNPVERAYFNSAIVLRQHQQVQALSRRSKPADKLPTRCLQITTKAPSILDTFGSEQVKIFLFDEPARQRPDSCAIQVHRSRQPLRSQYPKAKPSRRGAQKFNHQPAFATKNPLKTGAAKVLRAFTSEDHRQKWRSQLISANSQGQEKQPLTHEERKLLEDYYREDILQLKSLNQTSHWFQVNR